jgi:hypothetical protein
MGEVPSWRRNLAENLSLALAEYTTTDQAS